MTHTRATTPTLISSHSLTIDTTTRNEPHKQLQTLAICSKLLQIATKCNSTQRLHFSYNYGMISKDERRKEQGHDRNEREILYSRASGRDVASLNRYHLAPYQQQENQGEQDWQSVAHQRRCVGEVSRGTKQHSRRQKIKAGITRLSKNLVAQLFSRRGKQLENSLSSRYLVSIIGYDRTPSQALLCFSARGNNRYGGGREDTLVITTIGIPSFQVYPSGTNDAPAIFGVCGSEVRV
jgi:hypothetical protein